MVDIDEEEIANCKKYLPAHSQGSFEDQRTELYHVDARDYLAKCGEAFDIIIIDLPDPIEEGPAYLLYTREFYQLVRGRLAGVYLSWVDYDSLIPFYKVSTLMQLWW